jgi:hypothetical protein
MSLTEKLQKDFEDAESKEDLDTEQAINIYNKIIGASKFQSLVHNANN